MGIPGQSVSGFPGRDGTPGSKGSKGQPGPRGQPGIPGKVLTKGGVVVGPPGEPGYRGVRGEKGSPGKILEMVLTMCLILVIAIARRRKLIHLWQLLITGLPVCNLLS